MIEVFVRYEGDLHCSVVHQPSSATLSTDAPVDNHGKGQTFSPTDLVAAALGSCMATVMAIWANKRALKLDGTSVKVAKHMSTTAPRRIVRLVTQVAFPEEVAAKIDEPSRKELEQVAHNCPVRLSVHDSIDVPVTFKWGDIHDRPTAAEI